MAAEKKAVIPVIGVVETVRRMEMCIRDSSNIENRVIILFCLMSYHIRLITFLLYGRYDKD